MRYLTLGEVVELHRRVLQAGGGAPGIRDLGALDSAKRVGHAAMETFLVLNGTEIDAAVDDQEPLMLDLAAGRIDRVHLTDWLRHHLRPLA